MKQDTDRGVIVIGEPGAGKSALTAQLICSRSSNPFIHKRIIGYHLCKHADKATQDPGRFVRNLVDLMARRVPEYGMLISNSSLILSVLEGSCLRDPFECFEQALMAPLLQLKGEPQFYFIVIDALDECSSDNGGTSIVQFIRETSSKLPKWIKLVMTSRNDSNVLRHFSHVRKVYMSSTDARNLQDIEIFITTKLFEEAPILHRLKVALGFSSGEEISFLTRKLLSQSQGNFLFVKEMFHFWEDEFSNDADLKQLPKTIGGIYENYLKRVYGSREKFKSALAILEIMVAAFEPMQVDRVFQVLRMQENIDYEYDFVYALKDLSHFIRYEEDNTITIFHLSFTEWLTSSENIGNPYYVSRKHGHGRLAKYYLSVVKKNQNSMDIYHLAHHISFWEGDENFLEEFGNINASYINASINSDNKTLLHLAAEDGNLKLLQLLAPAFESVDCEDNYGFTPCFLAAKKGLKENVEFLISRGANTDHRTKPPPPIRFVREISSLMFDVDPLERAKTTFWNSTMMHAAASGGHTAVIRALLKRNASFHDVNGANLTAIQLAAQNGHLDVVQILYFKGADADHLSLQLAAHGGHPHVIKFLLKTGLMDTCLRCDGSFYWLGNKVRYQAASWNNSTGLHRYILSHDNYRIECQSALHLAVAGKHTEVTKLLLSMKYTAIHCKDFTGRTPLHEAVRQNDLEIAELLIRSGARISQKCMKFQNLSSSRSSEEKGGGERIVFLNKREQAEYYKDLCHCGTTPFLLAARYGLIEVASLLLRYGARPDDEDCQGAMPLHIAACHGHYDFIEWLLSQRPSIHINIKSKNLSTPLHSGAICNINKDIKPLLDMGASIYETDENGMTPMHYAVVDNFEKYSNLIFEFEELSSSSFITVWGPEGDITVTHDSYVSRAVPLSFQCLKLIEIIKSSGASYINEMDTSGKTALHLAARTGEECCVLQLLKNGARTDLNDKQGKIPLDFAMEFATKLFYPRMANRSDEKINFDLILALNRRYHNSVADILLSREYNLSQACKENRTDLLHRAFEKQQPIIAYLLLSKGHKLSCKDAQGRSPLLIYLQNGGEWLDVVLRRFDVPIHIECGKPFNQSELHMLAFRQPTVATDNLLEYRTYDDLYYFEEDGPLLKAIQAHPSKFRVVDECRDAEGYTALHRAAQGGNLFFIKRFLSWGADPKILTSQGHSSLELSIMYGGISHYLSSPPTPTHTAERAVDLLFKATKRSSRFDVGCNRTQEKLTIYHLAAYRGLIGFVKTLLNDRSINGIDVNCSNVHGITPLYLAKLYSGTEEPSEGKRDRWQEVVDFITKSGGILTFPNREVELSLIYRHLYGSHPHSFTLDGFEKGCEQFYNSDFSTCSKDELNYHRTGNPINPHMKNVMKELLRITNPSTTRDRNVQLVPTDRDVVRETLNNLIVRSKALNDLSNLFQDVMEGHRRTNQAIRQRMLSTNESAVLLIKLPKLTEQPDIIRNLQLNKKELAYLDQLLRYMRSRYESKKSITSHEMVHLKNIAHRHSEFFGDVTKLVKLIEKHEESETCRNEIFQAKMISLKFRLYVLNSNFDDLITLKRSRLEKGEFLSKRVPSQWINAEYTNCWAPAVKFLYRQATQRYLGFDYLRNLTVGYDKDTRIPLSVDALYLLSLQHRTGGFV